MSVLLTRGATSLGSADSYVCRLQTLVPPFELELDVLPFFQALEFEFLQSSAVKENFVSLDADEPEPPITDDLLDRSFHANTSFPSIGYGMQVPVRIILARSRPHRGEPLLFTCWLPCEHGACHALAHPIYL